MTSARPPQPSDEWDFLSTDDDPDRDRDLDVDIPRAAEEAAMHIARVQTLTPLSAHTTAGAGSDGAADEEPPVAYFDDEEPEVGEPAIRRSVEAPEPDLEELLESQHYAFSPDADDVP